MDNLLDQLFARRDPDVTPEEFGDVVDRLTRVLEDDGLEFHQTLARWIREGDLDRVAVALHYRGSLLFEGHREMTVALNRARARFPQLSERCDEFAAQWERVAGRKQTPTPRLP
jgi:hypothetical protein